MDTKTDDKLAGAREQGQAQFDSIKEMVENLPGYRLAAEEAGWEQFTDAFKVLCWRHVADDATWAGTAEDLCQEFDLDVESAREAAREVIQEDPLSVQVRSGWHAPGAQDGSQKPEEYEILLCTGGPAVRLVGTLSEHLEPDTARLEVQDWFTPWVEMRPRVVSIGVEAQNDAEVTAHYDSEPILLEYARQFWFGE